jgi:hypothetical protein
MTWLAWRQARVPVAVALAGVAAVLVVALAVNRQDGTVRMWLGVLVVVVPGIAGLFWGAPLVADELESGTFRLAWTQDVSRARWIVVRLLATGLAAMAVTGLLSLIVTWWAGPPDRAGLDQFGTFDSRDIVPIGYAALALALGALAGAVLRRTVPAMAVTLLTFTAARVAFRLLARPALLAPAVRSLPLDPTSTGYGASTDLPFIVPAATLQPAPPDLPNAWVTGISIVNRSGTGLTTSVLNRSCPGIGGGRAGGGGVLNPLAGGGHTTQAPPGAVTAMQECVARLATTYHEVVTYQPASRYWPLQWSELCVYLAAALALAALTVWRVRRIGLTAARSPGVRQSAATALGTSHTSRTDISVKTGAGMVVECAEFLAEDGETAQTGTQCVDCD